MTCNKLTGILTFGTLALLAGAAANAETTNCTPITSLPAAISSQGVYCLTGHLATSQTGGVAIAINVPNVVLDLNSWKVGGQGAGKGTTALGIASDQANVTVRNGTVRGFNIGILLTGAGSVVEDVLADQNTVEGIYVGGNGSVVRRNRIVNTGGSTTAADVSAIGIGVFSLQGVLIEDNTVSGLYPVGNGNAFGIELYNSEDGVVRGNTVSGSATPAAGFGIVVASSSRVTVIGNAISNFAIGVSYGTSSGIYARNVADGCTTKYSGGTAGTGND